MILTVLMLSPLCREQTKSNPFTTAFVTRTLQRFKLICKAVIWFQQRNSERLNTRVVCSCFMQRRHLKGDAEFRMLSTAEFASVNKQTHFRGSLPAASFHICEKLFVRRVTFFFEQATVNDRTPPDWEVILNRRFVFENNHSSVSAHGENNMKQTRCPLSESNDHLTIQSQSDK